MCSSSTLKWSDWPTQLMRERFAALQCLDQRWFVRRAVDIVVLVRDWAPTRCNMHQGDEGSVNWFEVIEMREVGPVSRAGLISCGWKAQR